LKRLALLTSGGDAPGMNPAIRAVVRKCIYHGIEVWGVKRGFSGLVNQDFRPMDLASVADIIHRGGTVLKTARCPEFYREKVQEETADILKKMQVDGLVVIGGDGSFRGAMALENKGIATVGIPGTIDNDIPRSEYTIGFDTALNTVTHAVNSLRDTATSHERVYVIEVMGRNNGNIALMAGLAGGAESIMVPEKPFNLDEISNRVMRGVSRGKAHNIIMVSEGAANAIEVGEEIRLKTGMDTRVTILGHIQRGGTPSAYDRIMASRMAALAVDLLKENRSGGAVCLSRGRLRLIKYSEIFSSECIFKDDIYDLAKILSI